MKKYIYTGLFTLMFGLTGLLRPANQDMEVIEVIRGELDSTKKEIETVEESIKILEKGISSIKDEDKKKPHQESLSFMTKRLKFLKENDEKKVGLLGKFLKSIQNELPKAKRRLSEYKEKLARTQDAKKRKDLKADIAKEDENVAELEAKINVIKYGGQKVGVAGSLRDQLLGLIEQKSITVPTDYPKALLKKLNGVTD